MAKRKFDYGLKKNASKGTVLAVQYSGNRIDEIIEVEIEKLILNPYQPRIEMKEEALLELATSIKLQGLLQPIVVAKDGDTYTIIAGHRRVKAHKMLSKRFIKAIVKDHVVQAQFAILPLIENLQRADTDPIENAIAFKRIVDEKLVKSQQELANLIGVSTSWLSKSLSILKLPDELLVLVKKDKYIDITVLSALNKTDAQDAVSVYQKVKNLKRKEALDYIRSLVVTDNSEPKTCNFVRSKLAVSINLTHITSANKEKVETLLKEIESLLS